MTGVRVARAARSVTVTRSVYFTLNDDTVVTVMAVHEQGQKSGNEEENDVHDSESPGSLEHGALTVDVPSVRVSGDIEETKISVVGAVGVPVGAIGIGDTSELVNGSNEGADEEEIDKGNELGRVPCARIEEKGAQSPCCTKDGDDEKNQDRRRGEEVAAVVPVDEPCQHTQGWNQGDDLEDPPEDEGKAGEGHDRGRFVE